MYGFYAITAGVLSLMFFGLPEFNYWEYWYEQSMKSNLFPNIPGV